MKHYIIYIPGLGDHYDDFRHFFLSFWRLLGVKVELVPMRWYDGGTYEEKYERVLSAIKAAQEKGYKVSLIGESAGASMAINVFAHDDSLHRLVSLCGVNSSKTPIEERTFAKSVAFKKSVSLVDESRTKILASRVTSITGFHDSTVPAEKNIIPHARNIKAWGVGHLGTIGLCLSIYSFILIREAKR